MEGRPPSAAGVELGAVEVDDVTYKYTIHRKTWKLTVQPGFGGKRHGVCTILNGEVADEATFARRIRAAPKISQRSWMKKSAVCVLDISRGKVVEALERCDEFLVV
ncbi:hypothetical protein M885DRAFT_623837 [Pelagophyceae sp. CCMP2097]|nr:hypothetical protein M885DRAFT_623837 [Pelagophyceae sp. CCMP2097]